MRKFFLSPELEKYLIPYWLGCLIMSGILGSYPFTVLSAIGLFMAISTILIGRMEAKA